MGPRVPTVVVTPLRGMEDSLKVPFLLWTLTQVLTLLTLVRWRWLTTLHRLLAVFESTLSPRWDRPRCRKGTVFVRSVLWTRVTFTLLGTLASLSRISLLGCRVAEHFVSRVVRVRKWGLPTLPPGKHSSSPAKLEIRYG